MSACARCGTDLPADARFCPGCGASLAGPATAQPGVPPPTMDVAHAIGSRRVVTVLFSDLVGSTALGERLDPELLRDVLARYFAAMAAVIHAHGGAVEKYVGDAIMAVFGLEAIHEDDALRAVRAAAGMRDALERLNQALADECGVTLAARTGIATGEVVAGDPASGGTLATGDTINTAARLEQAAGPGEILLGATTWQLVRSAVTAESVAPISAKGKASPVAVHRLLSVRGSTADAPPSAGARTGRLVGRSAELARVEAAYVDVVRRRAPALVVVQGPAGAGKSRLTEQVADHLAAAGARVLRGRCLSYGEGVTWWPVRGILHQAAGILEEDDRSTARQRLRTLTAGMPDGSIIEARLATAIGLSDTSAPSEELIWAVRRTLDQLARSAPLVVIVEDIHWAEAPLLELLEHIVVDASDAPLLLIAPSRPDLGDRSPGWGTGVSGIHWLTLEPLDPATIRAITDAVPGAAALDAALRARAVARAEGNPLFAEELVRMLVEDASASSTERPLPPTIEAVLAARLDTLSPGERRTAQRASVVGRSFEVATVTALTPEPARSEVGATLDGLARRDLVAPEPGDGTSPLGPPEAYRFRHILIRDAAYARLTRRERAELHERFATWLETTAGDRSTEYQEILGHHLASAWTDRSALHDSSEAARDLGTRAAGYLVAAATRARERGDASAAIALLDRAEGLPSRDDASHAALLVESARARFDAGHAEDAVARADAALVLALDTGRPAIAAVARVIRSDASVAVGTHTDTDPIALAEAQAALQDAQRSGDPVALTLAWNAMVMVAYMDGRLEEASAHADHALQFARRTGDERLVLDMEINHLVQAFVGPTPARDVADLARSLLDRAAEWPTLHADVLRLLGPMEAMLELHAAALEHLRASIAILRDLALPDATANCESDLGAWVYRLAGDLAAAEAAQRAAHETARGAGNASMGAYTACRVAQELVAQGRLQEAAPWLDEAELLPAITNRTRILGMRARIRAVDGDRTAADEVPRMLGMLDGTPFLNIRVDALQDAAAILATLGRDEEAAGHLREARALSAAKGNLARVRLLGAFAAGLGLELD